MFDDVLTRHERIRLECLAQANAVVGSTNSAEAVVKRADIYEEYVRNGAVLDE